MEGLKPIKAILENSRTGTPTRSRRVSDEEEPAAPSKAVFGVSDMSHTFKNFKGVKGTEAAYGAFKYITDCPDTEHWRPFLFCYGGTGNGKTHLLEALAIELHKSMSVRLWVWADFLSFLKRMMKNETEDIDTIVERYQTDDGALLLDDVGMEYGTDWEESILERIISGRYRNKAITVITTNKDIDQVDDKGRRCIPERIKSRFSDQVMSRLVLNEGEDYREKGQSSKKNAPRK